MVSEFTHSRGFGLRNLTIWGNPNAQAADDATHATDFPGLALLLGSTPKEMQSLWPGLGSGDHRCLIENVRIRDAAGTGMVVEHARESRVNQIHIAGARRWGFRGAIVDSSYSEIVTETSNWGGALFSSKGGTSRVDQWKSWFSGVRGWEAWAAYREYVRANGTGSLHFAPPDYLDTPWGVDFSIRTAGCIFNGLQSQDSDGPGLFLNTTNSIVQITGDSPGNLYKAALGNSGGLLQGDGIRTAPTPAKRRHVVMAGCKRVQLDINTRTRAGADILSEHIIEFIGTNTGCTVNGVHDGSFTVSAVKGATTSQITLAP